MTDHPAIRWGIIGPGAIARTFAAAIPHTETGRLVAVASREPTRPELREGFPGARIVDGYATMLADPEVDAIYIATPHPAHTEWTIKAAQAGKHVLCEKPMAVSRARADAMVHAAQKAGTFLGEAFMYRLHPQTSAIVDLVKSGKVGEVRLIRADNGFRMKDLDPQGRTLSSEAAGGGILDVGCYPVSLARLIAGAAAGKSFLDPVKIVGNAYIGATGVDEWASAVLRFPNEIIAEVSCSVTVAQDNTARVMGTNGWFEVRSPWLVGGFEGGPAEIVIHRPRFAAETVRVAEKGWLFAFQIDAAGRAIREGKTEFDPPGPTWADTLGNMRALDDWRAAVGLEYDFEKPRRGRIKVDGRPLGKPSRTIPKLKIPGIDRQASVVALGGGSFETYTQAAILLYTFYEAGGNVLDTAWLYTNGLCDRIFGGWMKSRGVRSQMIVIGKGAHSPLVYPDVIAKQLDESLDRLKTDHLEIYLMHRDNPAVPVGEFVDAMDAEVSAGRVGIYGGSNWTRERMDAAFTYAKKRGRSLPRALSNNFSLAEMVNPVWPGVLASSDSDWKAWLRKRKIPLFAWSSQGRGFFTERAAPEKLDDQELVRSWYSKRNFARRARAVELAQRRGVGLIHIALAYCLAQDFPVVPIIGPLTIGELQDSLKALDLGLSADDVRWLEEGGRLR